MHVTLLFPGFVTVKILLVVFKAYNKICFAVLLFSASGSISIRKQNVWIILQEAALLCIEP